MPLTVFSNKKAADRALCGVSDCGSSAQTESLKLKFKGLAQHEGHAK